MAFGINNILYVSSLTGAMAQVSGNAIDLRAGQGAFCLQLSASGTNAGFGNSALVKIEHTLDPNTAVGWIQLTLLTASGTGTFTQTWYSAGAYAFVRASLPAVYSGATGTGVIHAHIFANNQGG